jgi:hemoglobin
MPTYFVLVTPAADEADRTTLAQAETAYQWLKDRERAGMFTLGCFESTGGVFFVDLDADNVVDAETEFAVMTADYPLTGTVGLMFKKWVPLETGFATLYRKIAARNGGSIFDRLGGQFAVDTVVAYLYREALTDPILSPRFSAIDMPTLVRHQRQFLATALGGPDTYRGRSIADAHAGLGIAGEEFDRVAVHVAGGLRLVGASPALIDEVLAAVGSLRGDVVAAEATAPA